MTLKKIAAYALGPVGSAALGLLTLPLMSWYFPAEDIGRMVMLQTVSALLLLLLGMGLDQAYIREYHAAADKAALLKSLAAAPLLLSLPLLAALVLLAAPQLSGLLLDWPDAAAGILLGLFFALSLPMRYGSLILRMQERALWFSVSQLLPKLVLLLLVCLCFFSGIPAGTQVLLTVLLVSQLPGAAFLLLQTRRDIAQAAAARWQPALFSDGLRYGLPLVLGYLAYWGFTSADRFALKYGSSLSELGIYSMAVNFGAVALVFQSVFSTIWAPMVFEWVKNDAQTDKIHPIALDMTDLMAALLCLTGLLSPLAAWLLPPQYAPVQFILLSSMLFPLLYTLTEVSGIGLNVVRKTWLVTWVSLAALACNCLLLFLFVPTLGAKGAAAATAVSFWLFFVLKTELSSRVWQPLPRRKMYGRTLLCLAVCLSYTFWGTPATYPLFALIWSVWLLTLCLRRRHRLAALADTLKSRLKN
ncbi:lipopolysaccharide biosynthesis protein [Bergeriella denitrificans]